MHHTEFDTVNFVTAFHRMAKVPDAKAATGRRVLEADNVCVCQTMVDQGCCKSMQYSRAMLTLPSVDNT